MLRIATSLLLSSLLTLTAWSATPYSVTAAKAARFFEHGEWASASAMYTLMLDEHTDSVEVFGHAIVAAGMMNLPEEQIELFTRALNAQQSIDAVLQATEAASRKAEQAELYEGFLYSVRNSSPWLKRIIDSKLLSYYIYRNDGPGIVSLSLEMLNGLPDDERFLYTLAGGQLLSNDIPAALATYHKINNLYPNSLDALLYLGLHYSSIDPTLARGYLQRALDIRWTPHVAAAIDALGK